MTLTEVRHPTASPTSVPARATPPGPGALSFDRTVDRTLVHRAALSEVFVTDAAGSEGTFTVAAQLPPSHAYYGDHTSVVRAPDPLLLLECARQAETLGVHRFLGAPAGTGFLLSDWSLDVADLHDREWPAGPLPLTIVNVPTTRRGGGRLRAAEHRMELFVGDSPVGEVRMTVAYLPRETYQAVRPKCRGSVPPMSDQIDTGPERGLADPRQVGRRLRDNVVLHTPRVTDDGIAAQLRSVGDHPSLFDHPQDHVPGMTLMEAARQSALVSAAECGFGPPEHTAATAFDATFDSYTELDRVTTVRAERPRPITADRCAVRVSIEQASGGTATATVGLRRVGHPAV